MRAGEESESEHVLKVAGRQAGEKQLRKPVRRRPVRLAIIVSVGLSFSILSCPLSCLNEESHNGHHGQLAGRA